MNFKKFITIGLAAVITSTAAMAGTINALPSAGVSAQETAVILSVAQDIDISHIAPNVDVNYIVMKTNHIRSGGVGGEALANVTDQTCQIHMPVGTDFSSSHLGTNEYHDFLKSVVTPENANQDRLRTEFAVLHEASHCNLYSSDRPFRADNPTVENNLNQYFRLSGASFLGPKGENRYESIYNVLHENYADALAAMELIRTHGDTPDVLSVISKSATERHETASSRSKNEFEAHSGNYTLEEVIKPEMISKIMLAPTNKDLQELALQVANKGTFKVINTYGNVDNIVGLDSLYSGASMLAVKQIYGKVLGQQEKSNINMHHETNELYKIATTTVNEIVKTYASDFAKLKTEKDVKEWVDKNANAVFEEATNQVNYALGPQYEAHNDVNKSVAEYIKSSPKGEKLTVAQIKTKGSQDLAQVSSKDVPSVMANIESIRSQSVMTSNAVMPKLK